MLQFLFMTMFRLVNGNGDVWMQRISTVADACVSSVGSVIRSQPNAEYIRAERVRNSDEASSRRTGRREEGNPVVSVLFTARARRCEGECTLWNRVLGVADMVMLRIALP